MNIRMQAFKHSNCGLTMPAGIEPRQFVYELRRLPAHERVAMVRTWVQERRPAAFGSAPYLWEAVREWISERHGVSPRQVGLAGSAQIGFSTHPDKALAPFHPERSDLDLYIVSNALYSTLEDEARLFIDRQRSAQKSDYLEQARVTDKSLTKGYIDLWHIPAVRDRYPVVSHLKNDASIVIDRLRLSGYKLRPSHFRIYRDWRDKAAWTKVQADAWVRSLNSL